MNEIQEKESIRIMRNRATSHEVLADSMDPFNIAVKRVLPVVTYYWILPYNDLTVSEDGTEFRERKYKRDVVQIRIDVETGKYSYWMWVDELTKTDNKWSQISKKDFRRLFNTNSKQIIKYYGSSDDINEDDINEQMSLF